MGLTATPVSTSEVRLDWADPLGVSPSYTYSVQRSGLAGPGDVVSGRTHVVDGLQPGTRYDFNVTTVAAPGSDGPPEHASTYTSKTLFMRELSEKGSF